MFLFIVVSFPSIQFLSFHRVNHLYSHLGYFESYCVLCFRKFEVSLLNVRNMHQQMNLKLPNSHHKQSYMYLYTKFKEIANMNKLINVLAILSGKNG